MGKNSGTGDLVYESLISYEEESQNGKIVTLVSYFLDSVRTYGILALIKLFLESSSPEDMTFQKPKCANYQ